MSDRSPLDSARPMGSLNVEGSCRRPTVHRNLGLQLPDPPASLPQLLPLHRAHPRKLIPIDQLLPTPGVDQLLAHLEQQRDFPDRLASSDQIQRSPT